MGTQHTKSFTPSDEWERIESQSVTWFKRSTGQLMEEYEFTSTQQQLRYEVDAFNFRHNSPVLVASKYLNVQAKGQGCGGKCTGVLLLEKIQFRLRKVNQIPYPDVVHLYSQAFMGFSILHNQVGTFSINEEMIGVNSEGVVKVWLNSDFASSLPDTFETVRIGETDMLYSLVDLVESNTYQQSMPLKISAYLKNRNVKTFEQASRALKQKFQIPRRMDCVLEEERQIQKTGMMTFGTKIPPNIFLNNPSMPVIPSTNSNRNIVPESFSRIPTLRTQIVSPRSIQNSAILSRFRPPSNKSIPDVSIIEPPISPRVFKSSERKSNQNIIFASQAQNNINVSQTSISNQINTVRSLQRAVTPKPNFKPNTPTLIYRPMSPQVNMISLPSNSFCFHHNGLSQGGGQIQNIAKKRLLSRQSIPKVGDSIKSIHQLHQVPQRVIHPQFKLQNKRTVSPVIRKPLIVERTLNHQPITSLTRANHHLQRRPIQQFKSPLFQQRIPTTSTVVNKLRERTPTPNRYPTPSRATEFKKIQQIIRPPTRNIPLKSSLEYPLHNFPARIPSGETYTTGINIISHENIEQRYQRLQQLSNDQQMKLHSRKNTQPNITNRVDQSNYSNSYAVERFIPYQGQIYSSMQLPTPKIAGSKYLDTYIPLHPSILKDEVNVISSTEYNKPRQYSNYIYEFNNLKDISPNKLYQQLGDPRYHAQISDHSYKGIDPQLLNDLQRIRNNLPLNK